MRGGTPTWNPLAARGCAVLVAAFAIVCMQAASAQGLLDPDAPHGLGWRAGDALLMAQRDGAQRDTTPSQEPPPHAKSHVIPAVEILLFDVLVNRVNNHFSHTRDYAVTMDSVRSNLRGGWVTDNDPFSVNQFAHPYQGAMYHGFARSAGLGYWESSAYTFAGSAAWEYFGERTRPAVNDQVASGIAGSFLGETLYRMASLVLEDSSTPGWSRELFATVISPPLGLNRLLFGDRFGSVFESRGASYYGRVLVGASTTVHPRSGTVAGLDRNEALLDFSLLYGLPGKAGYEYTRPFDYFTFEGTATSANTIENLSTAGLLVGRGFGGGADRYRGLWGLFGSYDYIAPQSYRISTTALSVGARAQIEVVPRLAFQGSAMFGVGYAAVGALRVRTEHDYTYGVAPQALVNARLLWDERFAVEGTAREFFVSGVGRGTDNIARASLSATWRVVGRHAVALRYLWNRRDANSPILGSRTQIRSTIGLFYAFIGRPDFGAVDWQ